VLSSWPWFPQLRCHPICVLAPWPTLSHHGSWGRGTCATMLMLLLFAVLWVLNSHALTCWITLSTFSTCRIVTSQPHVCLVLSFGVMLRIPNLLRLGFFPDKVVRISGGSGNLRLGCRCCVRMCELSTAQLQEGTVYICSSLINVWRYKKKKVWERLL